MKRNLLIFIALALTAAACTLSFTETSSPSEPISTKGSCGDQICDGPENATNCPEDCKAVPSESSPHDERATALTEGETPPLYFFYAIHTHVSGDFHPHDPGLSQINTQTADNMLAAIEGIQAVLDRYGVKATWEVVYGTASGLCEYGGEHHVFQQLIASGHEIGLHVHSTEDIDRAYQALVNDCDIIPKTASGFLLDAYRLGSAGGAAAAQDAFREALTRSSQLGMHIVTENLSPGGEKSIMAEACNDQFGIGNDMWAQSGNLMFPWRPDYANANVCAHNPQGDILFIDHVSIEALILPGDQAPPDILGDIHFNQLKEKLDGALAYMQSNQPERPAVWGFVTHISEYAQGSRAAYPPDSASLAALNRFLAYVAEKEAQGAVVFATASEIGELMSTGP